MSFHPCSIVFIHPSMHLTLPRYHSKRWVRSTKSYTRSEQHVSSPCGEKQFLRSDVPVGGCMLEARFSSSTYLFLTTKHRQQTSSHRDFNPTQSTPTARPSERRSASFSEVLPSLTISLSGSYGRGSISEVRPPHRRAQEIEGHLGGRSREGPSLS